MKESSSTPPQSWCDVLESEYRALYGEAAIPPGSEADSRDPGTRLRAVHERVHARAPSAVCLSGGGIRSATFALGVLQGLAHAGVLRTVDYLSTVSGGGYTGGWLTAWLHRAGSSGRGEVFRELDPAVAAQTGTAAEDSPVDRVRRTCRYLAPQGGAASADMWALLMTMGRNLLLNWFVILPLLAAALLVPRIYYAIVFLVEVETPNNEPVCTFAALGGTAAALLAVAAAGWLAASAYIVISFSGRGGQWSQGRFLSFFLLPTAVAAMAFTIFWSAAPCTMEFGPMVFIAAVLPAVMWLVIGGARRGPAGVAIAAAAIAVTIGTLWFATHHLVPEGGTRDGFRGYGTFALLVALGWLSRRFSTEIPAANDGALRLRVGPATIFAALVSGVFLAAGVYWLAVYPFGFGSGLREFYATAAVPIILLILIVTITVFVGIASHELDDSALEWWSRAAGWIAIVAVAWAVAGVLVFYMADLIERGLRAITTAHTHNWWSGIVAVAVPLVSSLAGLAARNSTSTQTSRTSTTASALQSVALPLIIFLLLSSIAWVNLRVVGQVEYHRLDDATICSPALYPEDAGNTHACHPEGAGIGEVAMVLGAFLGFGLLMSRLVPVNRFSLHGMYRQRLIRTFLGASRRDRRPNAFTGFDPTDDLRVHDLETVRPLHVINTTLNAVETTHIGRHESKAESFTFSPLHVGNRFVGYRPAAEYGSDGAGNATGVSLGMALAVSGAAASSAMGMYSTKALAFLLTLANARLGLWFGNPASAKTWQRSEPPLGVEPLAREMLGLTTDHNPYVYLSDGGHYENLGLWEMVARRCRYIIVSDGGCDPTYTFSDLSNAVRRIRLDLGIPIHFDPLTQSREGQGKSNAHAAIGRIVYSAVDGPSAPDGTILYLKATLSGDEPVDVRNFASSDPLFPHDSTANQFFDEARFESYRALGYHTVLAVTADMQGIGSAEALCTIAGKVLRSNNELKIAEV